jgi:hypothetical protein
MKSTKRQETKTTIRFKAKLSRALLTLPKSASAKLQSRGAITVEGTINNLPFRATLAPDGKGSHQLNMGNAMCDALGATTLHTVAVEITRVGEEAETRVPMDLRKTLTALAKAGQQQAIDSWKDITPMARRDWIFSISTAKLAETRKRRIEKACDMLASGKRRLCCFPGIKWLMKENAKTCGIWLPLVNSQNLPNLPNSKK